MTYEKSRKSSHPTISETQLLETISTMESEHRHMVNSLRDMDDLLKQYARISGVVMRTVPHVQSALLFQEINRKGAPSACTMGSRASKLPKQ